MSEVAAVEAANDEFYAAFEAADLDRMGAVWDDEAEVVCVHPGWDALRGRARVMRSWAVIFANTPYIQFFLSDVESTVSGDLAVVTCAENILTAPGEPGGDAKVVSTNVFRLVDGSWRMTLHHGSPVMRQIAEEDPADE
ncbi:MAG TPA: nuclear transport factor 2 family protein [Mycobacteriales bacterium]|nr:nuclear transport factor 2 family protein [Mycobacteriales bacterium]